MHASRAYRFLSHLLASRLILIKNPLVLSAVRQRFFALALQRKISMMRAKNLSGLKGLLTRLAPVSARRLFFHQNPHSASESDIMLLTKQVDKQGLIAVAISLPICSISLSSAPTEVIMAVQHGGSKSKIILLNPLLIWLFRERDLHF